MTFLYALWNCIVFFCACYISFLGGYWCTIGEKTFDVIAETEAYIGICVETLSWMEMQALAGVVMPMQSSINGATFPCYQGAMS